MPANVEQLPPPVQSLDGCLDAVADGKLFGWAWDRERPTDKLVVELRRDDTVLVSEVADRRRADLAGSGIGDGAYAFELEMPAGVDPDSLTVQARSPSGDRTVVLSLRSSPQLDDMPEELQRLNTAIHGLALVQKQTANALLGVLREFRDESGNSRVAAIDGKLTELAAEQNVVRKQVETVEVFLTRFDTLLRQLDQKIESQRQARPPLTRATALSIGAGLFLVAVAMAAALIR
jgi:hypothetical protein